MKQDKVPTKLEMYQAFRDNLELLDSTELVTLPLEIGLMDIMTISAVKLSDKFDCVKLYPGTIFVKVAAFQIEIPLEGRCDALAVVTQPSPGVFEARVAIKSKMAVNDVVEVLVRQRGAYLYASTEPFRLAQTVFKSTDVFNFSNEVGVANAKELLLHEFVRQRIEEGLSMYNNVMYSDMLIGEATAYLWHEYLTWVPPDTPAKSV